MTSNSLIEEIYSKVGRNILLFQKLEFVIKYLVTISDITVNKNNPLQRNAIQMVNDMKLTLGTVVGKYIETHNRESQERSVESEYESFTFRVNRNCNIDFLEEKKKVLADMVTERNELVHHSLQSFQWDNLVSCNAFIQKLDIQYEKVDKLINEFWDVTKATNKLIEDFLIELGSEKEKKQHEHFLFQSNEIFFNLCYVATQLARNDGWTVFETAVLNLDLEPNELDLLKKQYNHKSLKKMMLATDLFDFQEEEGTKGGVRLLYRLKPNWEFSVEENSAGLALTLKPNDAKL